MSQRIGFTSNMLFGIGFLLFSAAVIFTFVTLGKVAAPADAADVDSAISQLGWANGALITLLMLIAYSYVRVYPDLRDNYLFVMGHLSLYLSLLAVSVAVLLKRSG